MYLTSTRPDVMFVVNFYLTSTKLHLQATKKILRYLIGTVDYGVFYKKGGNEELVAYTDNDYVEDLDDTKSTLVYVFLLSSGAISWLSKKKTHNIIVYYKSRIYSCNCMCLSSNLDEKDFGEAWTCTKQFYNCLLQQQLNN